MLLLTFYIGTTRFVIDARRVSQVIPRVPLQALPLVDPCIAGVLDLRGGPLAVVDLSMRLFGSPCASRLSTRIMIVQIQHADREVPLGLIAEQVMELSRADVPVSEKSVVDNTATVSEPASVSTRSAVATEQDCLGSIIRVDGELAQWIEVDRVLPEAVRRQLFDQILE